MYRYSQGVLQAPDQRCYEKSVTLLRKKFTEELESPTIFLRALLISPVHSYFQFFYELHGQLILVNFFLKLGKTNSLKIERAIWHLYFPAVFYLLSTENLRMKASFKTFSFERETVLKVAKSLFRKYYWIFSWFL